MKSILVVLAVFALSGCGRFDRWKAGQFGGAAPICVDGVLYLQFTSGTSVAYTPDGHIKTCTP